MWIFTQDGYISAVAKGPADRPIVARARDRQSLELLAEMTSSEIKFSPTGDYQYRVFVTREELTQFMTLSIEMLDYDNFKDRIAVTRGDDFHHACGEVWTVMNSVQDDEARQWYTDRYAARQQKA
jgi:hypothetical protein